MKNSFSNPFVSCTARDMSYADVMNYWCSPYDCYRINEVDLVSSSTPIIIEGSRGSGKTMILKHLSFFCQKENIPEGNYLNSICENGYLGIYFRYSADYSTLFDSLNCSKNYRDSLFEYYFQLCVSLEVSQIIRCLEKEFSDNERSSLFHLLSELLDDNTIVNADTLIRCIEKIIRAQDETIRKSKYVEIDQLSEVYSSSLLFDILDVLQDTISKLNRVMFIITIDEYENVGNFQRVINTFIRQKEGKNYTFRIGVRPEGIRDYRTNISDEFLQDGRDYIKKQLIVSSDDRTTKYSTFVKSVINKRLKEIPIYNQLEISIEDLLGKKENYEQEALFQVSGRKDHFDAILTGKGENEKKKILEVLRDSKNPLQEAYFIMRINRGEYIESICELKQEINRGVKNNKTKKFYLDMRDKYKASLLFWLIDKYKGKKLYYSFATYLYLSCGSIYDFIGLCRTLFDELESDYFKTIEKTPVISYVIQTKAARKYAEQQLEKIRINHDYGPQMFKFVQNMCNLLSFYHKGDLCLKYPETNQFYISGDFENTGINMEIWKSLLRWGIVVKKTSLQRASVSVSSKAQLYYINKSYYPVYGISCRIRGGYNIELSNDIWDNMITSMVEPSLVIKKKSKKRLKFVQESTDSANKNNSYQQLSLFDQGVPNE